MNRKKEIEKLKLFEMKPPPFADAEIDRLEREVMNDKWMGRNPKRNLGAKINIILLNRIKRQVFIDNLSPKSNKQELGL